VTEDQVRFAAGLYQGTAGYYDRYRLPYPETMIADLACLTAPSGHGRLLDLACGTGQLTFPLLPWFAEAWAVDREAAMVDVVRAKAAAAGADRVRPLAVDAETLRAPPGHFELAVIGNAFHRLNRDVTADLVFGWLKPGGCLALCWSDGPWPGEADWQRALADVVERWRQKLGAGDRVPAGWNLPRRRRSDHEVLAAAGFGTAVRREYAAGHRWSLPELAGFVRATAVLPASVRGDQAAAFDADLAASLGRFGESGVFTQTVSFACDLARKPC
jgi:SAM-dependent methyltransferase